MEEEIIKLRKSGLTYDEITILTKCDKTTISKYCRKHNVSKYTGKITIPSDTLVKIQEDYDSGLTIRELMIKYNYGKVIISRNVINKRVKTKLSSSEKKKSKVDRVVSWRQRTKKKLVDYKGGCCNICGYNKSIFALEFHHVDPTEKDFNIAGKSYSFERLVEEVDKCILVCSNCHSEIHNGLYDYNELSKLLLNENKLNIKSDIKYVCECGEKISVGALNCTKCALSKRRKVERPPYEQLLKDIEETNYCAVGRKYGVSDNTIRNWKKDYEKNN